MQETLETVIDIKLLQQWVDKVLVPVVYNEDTFVIKRHNYIFNKPFIRASINKVSYSLR